VTSYAFSLWGQTVLALAGLALAGGWALYPFRGEDRPYLWLASPLAGLAALALPFTVLVFLFKASLPLALLLCFAGQAALTITIIIRPGLPTFKRLVMPVLILAAVSGWAAYAANHTAIRAGEPTICLFEGSDALNYSCIGGWLLQRPGQHASYGPDKPFETHIYLNLEVEGSRPAAFLIVGAAGWIRGTSCLFSYDWLCGVVLASGILALSGLFASGPRGLFLLLGIGLTSSWFAIIRTGYLGKAIAYPGCLLVCFLFFETWSKQTVVRQIVACTLSAGVALSLNPMVPPVVLGVVLAGLVLGLQSQKWIGSIPSPNQTNWKSLGRAGLIYLAMVGPTFLFHRLVYGGGKPVYPVEWSFLFPVCLDLQAMALPLVGPALANRLLLGAAILSAIFLWVSFRTANVEATALLLPLGLLPACWLLDAKGLFAFHGLLFPLSGAGAVLVLQRLEKKRTSGWLLAPLWAAGLLLVALRGPQFYQNSLRYLDGSQAWISIFPQSEIEGLRAAIGTQPVDVTTGDIYHLGVIRSELALQGVDVQLQDPGRSRLLYFTGWKSPNFPKAPLTLSEATAWAPSGTIRFCGNRFQLSSDSKVVVLRGLKAPHGPLWDAKRRPGLWLGNDPSKVEICNGLGHTAMVSLHADAILGPGNPAQTPRTLLFKCAGRNGVHTVSAANGWKVCLNLEVPAGNHWLSLAIQEPDHRPLSFGITGLQLLPEKQSLVSGHAVIRKGFSP
jgi:hypothetical protein